MERGIELNGYAAPQWQNDFLAASWSCTPSQRFCSARMASKYRYPKRSTGCSSRVVEALRQGKVITVVPRTQRLTTQEAAAFLGISRPTLVKLLQQGKIPYSQPGQHRRILFSDLLHYLERRRAEQRAALDRMTGDASAAGLYSRTEDYATAHKAAHKRAARGNSS